ncbi:MAG: hypothetical protein NUW22_05185 [Acidobacteria bacterium]|nr:hypothetical protein [Acidobacteriota bacterium]
MADTAPYRPLDHSIVQAISGTWERFKCDDFVQALLDHILDEIKRVHWNVFQHQWSPDWHGDEVEDPQIPRITFVRPDCRHALPNFQHEDVCFRWYKWPGRGMSTNKNWTAQEWRDWHTRCLTTVRAFDVNHYDPNYARPVLVRPEPKGSTQ